jgi:hypothetical protein
MTQITLSLPEKKLKKFLDHISGIDYVKIEDPAFTVPAWQQKEVKKRLQQLKKKPSSGLTAKAFETKLNALTK